MGDTNKTKLFESTPVKKAVLTLAIPTVISSLVMVIYNLADNALKASKPGQQVHIFGIQLKDKVKICVQDAGHGIGKEHMEHLTEAFYREDKARSRKQGGAGLGLSLCKQIADIHNTELKFESEQGKGTLVLFELSLTGDDYA